MLTHGCGNTYDHVSICAGPKLVYTPTLTTAPRYFLYRVLRMYMIFSWSLSILKYSIVRSATYTTFTKTFIFHLKKNSILYIPKGFAHGYLCLKKDNKLVYLLSNYWFKKYEKVLDFNDNGIDLKMKNKKIITSKRDTKGMSLNQFKEEIKSL